MSLRGIYKILTYEPQNIKSSDFISPNLALSCLSSGGQFVKKRLCTSLFWGRSMIYNLNGNSPHRFGKTHCINITECLDTKPDRSNLGSRLN